MPPELLPLINNAFLLQLKYLNEKVVVFSPINNYVLNT